jgi:hypothetical protein
MKLYAFIVTAMMFSANANAQIVYTDANPDVVRSCNYPLCDGGYSIDLNNDGIIDFTFSPRGRGFGCGSCSSSGGNSLGTRDSAVIISTSQSWIADTVRGYALNRPIDSSLGWTNALHILANNGELCKRCVSTNPRAGGYRSSEGISGPWSNVSGKYLALKVQVGTDFYYGWVKLGVSIGSYLVSITITEYAYNSVANQPILAGQVSATKSCPGGSISLSSNFTSAAYQWQVNTGSGYADVIDNATYSGAATATLQISNATTGFYGYQFRCNINGGLSTLATLKFVNIWTGAVSNYWDNPANWSCGVLPDGNTDVVIDTGTAVLNVNGICRSITVSKVANFTADTGFDLQVTH